MLRVLLIGVLMILVLLPAYAAPKTPSRTVPVTWTMDVPPGWLQMKITTPQTLLVAYDSRQKDYVVTMNVVYNVVGKMTLDEVFKASETSAAKALKDYKLLDHGDAKVGGLPAYYAISTSTGPEATMKNKSFVVIRKGVAYTFTFGCPETHFKAHAKDFNSIIASVKWVEKAKR